MDRLPSWALWSIIPATAVLTPVLGFLMAVVAVMLLGVLKEVGMPLLLALAAAGANGFLLGRKSPARQWERGLAELEVQRRSSAIALRASTANVMPFPAPRVRLANRHRGRINP
jgi:hypothetical protein